LYLCYWMRQSGLADLLPALRDVVYVGLSAGSMVMAPNIGEEFVRWRPPTNGDRALGLVDFAMFPHLDHEDLPENTMADAERWAVYPQPGSGERFGLRHARPEQARRQRNGFETRLTRPA
jgi:peptidase E